MVEWPKGVVQGQLAYRSGAQEWKWTANFEVFDYFPRTVDRRGPQVPDGLYRFVVDGFQSKGGEAVPYHLESAPFRVAPWEGIVAHDLRVSGGDASFAVEPIEYPETYQSAIEFLAADEWRRRGQPNQLCFNCTFRPWAATADVASAHVVVERVAGGAPETVTAVLGPDGRWHADTNLRPGDRVTVPYGGVVDTYGEINGNPIGPVVAGA